MNARLQLEHYLALARRRLQWTLSAQGAALLAAVLLLVTLAAALLLRRAAFADSAAVAGRVALALAAAGVGVWFFLRWRAMRRGGGASALEQALPAQSGRVATYLQESAKDPGQASPLLDLLAEDAQRVADSEPLGTTLPARRIALPALGGVAAAALLLGVLFGVGGPLGEGARHLWLGTLPQATSIAAAAGGIAVRPGNATVRRNQDLSIAALVAGGSGDVQVHVRFDSDSEWEIAPMTPDAEGGFGFTLYAVRDAARYYVTAGNLKSAEHRIDVVDLPTIESLRLTYEYPRWTGLPLRIEEAGGDIRAVAGTRVAVEVVTSEPLQGPLLVINGDDNSLDQAGLTSRGTLPVKEAGHYRIATRFGDEIVPLTPDYAIELVVDEKPNVEIVRPGRDYRATAIEEVPVRVRAQDDFRLEALELHFSVNGGDWRKESLPAGTADIQAAALLRLEEMQRPGPRGESPLLEPGDLVSYYALARDHQHSVQTDLFLIQVQPFEQRFTQSQAGGGGGGGGGGEEQDGDISRRQREVLLATWNLQRSSDAGGERDKERIADNARMLAQVQETIAAQATSLVERARARELTGQDANINQFLKSLQDAVKAMQPAAKSLGELDLQAAVQHEQQALQHLLRAESTFRDIQVAMQSQGGGGGGGGSQASRDVSEMTELELDLEKNQYETEPQMSAQQRNQAEDESLRRLRELARRQEQLAREAARQNQNVEAQRWQQEQLRREAEELRRQLEQLAQQQSQQNSSSQSGSQQSGQQQANSRQGGQQQRGQQQGQQNQRQQAQAQAAAEAARQVSEAMEQMRAANDRASRERASEQLNRARERLEQGREDAERERFSSLADTAGELAERQRQAERDLRAAIGNRPPPSIANPNTQRNSGMTFQQMERMARERRQLQSELEELQRRIETTRRATQQDSPRASRQLAEARRELQELDTIGSLGRSARDIERGRGPQTAATLEPVITDTLERLRQNLESAVNVAQSEAGPRQSGREADAGDLLAELGQLRRALEQARQQGVAQNQRGGEPGAQSPDAREGQAGQGGGQRGEQGQGGQGERGEGGNTPGGEGGATGGADGGAGDFGRAGSGADRFGGSGRFLGGTREPVPQIAPGREALRAQTQMSAERLAQLRAQLANGVLTEADAGALQELAQRLQRGGADPMAPEYQRMTALVNQLELAALKAQQAKDPPPTRSGETVDDSRRYRDNVAEYYRRLGGGND